MGTRRGAICLGGGFRDEAVPRLEEVARFLSNRPDVKAFVELKGESMRRFGPEVVEALVIAIERRGEVYGSPDEESTAEVERLVKERAIRA